MAEQVKCANCVPVARFDRDRIRERAAQVVASLDVRPPLSFDELRRLAAAIVEDLGIGERFVDFAAVAVSNEMWRDEVAAVPFERRVLLLPQCLRDRSECPATIDEFGLLCESCGRCPTGVLQDEAERLGYVVLVAEGTTVVTQLIETAQIDAVVGVSCLATLERSFPHMTSSGTPGFAIPLVRDGCDATGVEVDAVFEAIRMSRPGTWCARVDLEAIKDRVEQWFRPTEVHRALSLKEQETESLAASWMAQGGKRWRPVLMAAVAAALTGDEIVRSPLLREIALAVECFHKASLIHDDIEDGDDFRYGVHTLHRSRGVPVALNVGDLLIGEGYRLIGECGASPENVGRMLNLASRGHRRLCLGQGAELAWSRLPGELCIDEVLAIFENKTAPAFEVALRLGAVCGGSGADAEIHSALSAFSRALGVAYQVRDDIEDFDNGDDIESLRPSLLLALALEKGDEFVRQRLLSMVRGGRFSDGGELFRATEQRLRLREGAWRVFDEFRQNALEALAPIRDTRLKSLLYRVVFKVLKTDRPDRAAAEQPAVPMVGSPS